MIEYIDHRVLKTSIGTFVAVYIAELLGIKFPATAGIIAIISIQATKKESVKIAVERFIASIIGLSIAAVLFYFLGFNSFILGVFIFIFMPLCLKFNLFQGFLATVVSATHILVMGEVSVESLSNEFIILLLGMSTALVLNLYMPNVSKELKESHQKINNLMKDILNFMSEELLSGAITIKEDKTFKTLKKEIYKARDYAFIDYNNALFYASRYRIELFNLKRAQYKVLVRMRRHFYKFYLSTEHTLMVSQFTKEVSDSIGVNKIYKKALLDLQKIKETFVNTELPNSREKFENRAVLYQFLNDIEEFLELKEEFLTRYTLEGKKIILYKEEKNK